MAIDSDIEIFLQRRMSPEGLERTLRIGGATSLVWVMVFGRA